MRNGGPDYMEIVINNPNGPCDGIFSCSVAVRQILKKGQKMLVWYPDGHGGLRSSLLESAAG